MAQAKNWVFTLNNPTNQETEDLLLIGDNPAVCYCVYQLEAGVEGTAHFQGYIQMAKRSRMTQVKAVVSRRAHVEKAVGTPAQNRVYCTKEPRQGGPFEFGQMSTQGKRNDIQEFKEAMKENILSEEEILEQFPLVLAKYPRFVSTTRRILRESQLTDDPLCPRPGWQTELKQHLDLPADLRKIRWYFDADGGSGKSFFCRHFRRGGRRPFVITGGKFTDIYHAYDRQPVVFFDWPRSQEETFPYAVVETFKNGYFLSTKYESTPVYFESPHVVIFANFYPDKSKLSADRWDIHVINENPLNPKP